MTRSSTSSGNWSANAMIVMPPMECPTRTSGPSGAAASMHRLQVAAELVDRGGLAVRLVPAPLDRPWLRWSQ